MSLNVQKTRRGTRHLRLKWSNFLKISADSGLRRRLATGLGGAVRFCRVLGERFRDEFRDAWPIVVCMLASDSVWGERFFGKRSKCFRFFTQTASLTWQKDRKSKGEDPPGRVVHTPEMSSFHFFYKKKRSISRRTGHFFGF